MTRAPLTTLFGEVSTGGHGPSGVAVSFVLHCVVLSGSLYTLHHQPRILEPSLEVEPPVRLLTLNRTALSQELYPTFEEAPKPEPAREAKGGGKADAKKSDAAPSPAPSAADSTPAPAPASVSPPVSRPGDKKSQLAALAHPKLEKRPDEAKQTLVDPSVKPSILLKELTPLPTVVLWEPEPMRVKEVTPAPPDKVTAAPVKTALTPPNHEPDLADIQISSAPGATEKLAMAPSTTAPVTIVQPKAEQRAPQTATNPEKRVTPAAVMSISDQRLEKGTLALPPANQVASSKDPESSRPGKDSAGTNGAKTATASAQPTKNAGSGTGQNSNRANQNPAGAGKSPNGSGQSTNGLAKGGGDRGTLNSTERGSVAGKGNSPSATAKGSKDGTEGYGGAPQQHAVAPDNAGGGSGLMADDPALGAHISLPPDGRFGAVIVGNSISDSFPETEGLMPGRLLYTVYLQVGLPRSWILQYSLPASSERGINTIRPEAPFPYDMYRPQIDPAEVSTDAIVVHGLVNATGHFEGLEIVYPHKYVRAKTFLASLDKWKFRPALQEGLPTPVEILLIVPVS